MALVIGVLLAVFVLPSPWGLVAVVVSGSWEVATALGAMWWTQRRRAAVGAEALIGRDADVREPLTPTGRVRVKGELWKARCEAGAGRGDTVRIVGLDGLTLVVEPTPRRAGP